MLIYLLYHLRLCLCHVVNNVFGLQKNYHKFLIYILSYFYCYDHIKLIQVCLQSLVYILIIQMTIILDTIIQSTQISKKSTPPPPPPPPPSPPPYSLTQYTLQASEPIETTTSKCRNSPPTAPAHTRFGDDGSRTVVQ